MSTRKPKAEFDLRIRTDSNGNPDEVARRLRSLLKRLLRTHRFECVRLMPVPKKGADDDLSN